MKYLRLLPIVVLVLIGCNRPAPSEDETPKALQEGYSDISLDTKRSWYSDMVEQLYAEALKNNENLAQLNESIEDFADYSYDDSKPVHEYIGKHNTYFQAVNQHISSISDSLTAYNLHQYFDELSAEYSQDYKNHEHILHQIAQRTQQLQEAHTILKLYVTAPMFAQYHNNELPSAKEIEQVLETANKLLNETEEIIESKQP